jgi:hypothetical protein
MLDPLWADVTISARDLARSRRRAASAASAAAFGVAALILAAGFIDWIFLAMRDATIHSQLGHIKVVRPGYYRAGQADPFAFLLPGDAPEFRAIRSVPHYRIVAPRLAFNALLSRGDTTVSVIGEGVMPEKETELGRSIAISQGRPLASDEDQVVVGEGLARLAGIKVGDSVVLLATTGSGGTHGRGNGRRNLYQRHQGRRRLGSESTARVGAETPAGVRRQHLDRIARRNRCDRGGSRVSAWPNARERLRSRPLDRARRLLQQDRCDIFTTGLVRARGHSRHHRAQHREQHDDDDHGTDGRDRHFARIGRAALARAPPI